MSNNEVELQLKLDTEGRTVSTQGGDIPKLDYSSRTVLTLLADESEPLLFSDNTEKRLSFIDDLLFDCEITDCALLPRTFWINCQDRPRCAMEQCALEVFKHHVPNDTAFDPDTSGAEWWVQIRPSPPAGRYNLLTKTDGKKYNDTHSHKTSSGEVADEDDDLEASGICFHWDKDEDLRLMMGGNMYIHPHISTVTYLTSVGAPTLALNYRVNPLTGEYMSPQDEANFEAYVSCPKRGKHLSFDGRYLHAAPKDLMPKGLFEDQIKISPSDDVKESSEMNKLLSRRHRRVTFLVNIWLNYKPFNVDPFPESMMDKMTKVNEDIPFILFNDGVCHETCHVKPEIGNCGQGNSKTTNMKWPMGGCGSKEVISMDLPLESIHNEVKSNGNIRVTWERNVNTDRDDGVRILVQDNDVLSLQKALQLSCEQTCKRPKTDSV
mmetsp:Transcript_13095/g.24612  ORF Transcript_13095/g.24612 Transcript_13095/m.24612 type:complete len:436 (-) Transcript_13095:14-1321(-)